MERWVNERWVKIEDGDSGWIDERRMDGWMGKRTDECIHRWVGKMKVDD